MKRKLNILVVCQYYHPEPFLINEIAPELVKRGHKVTVLTGLPNYPEGVIPKEYRNGNKRKETINGVKVIRCSEVGRKGGKHKLILNYISYAFSASKAIKHIKGDYDLVFCYQLSPITMLTPAVRYKKKYHKPILTYCLDIWPESAKAHIPDKGFIFKKVFQLIEAYSKKMYGQCDRIAVTSEPFIQYLHDIVKVPMERMTYIPQHANGEMLGMELKSLGNDIADFLFAGNLGKGQKLDTIIEAAGKLKKQCIKETCALPDFCIHMVGDGSMKEELESLTKKLNVEDKFIFYGRKDRNEMPKYYEKADALLITLRGNNFVGNTMPGKLQTYMTVGKPILGAINGAAMQVIKEANCGACVPAEDAEGLCAIMMDYMKNPEKYKECGENARRYFKANFTMDVFLDRLEKEMVETAEK